MEPSATQTPLDIISTAFHASGLSISNYVVTLLEHPVLRDDPFTINLVNNANKIMKAFSCHPSSKDSAFDWAASTMRKKYSDSIRSLISCAEWHFNASHASAKQLEDFRIEDMAVKMKGLAPDLWLMLDVLLMGERKPSAEPLSVDADGDQFMSNSDSLDAITDSQDLNADLEAQSSDRAEAKVRKAEKNLARREALSTIKKVVMISIMMQSQNSKSNALESVFGIFLHSTNTISKDGIRSMLQLCLGFGLAAGSARQ